MCADTHIHPEKGLVVPAEYKALFEGAVVIRTPIATIQLSGAGRLNYIQLVPKQHFRPEEWDRPVRNPHLTPDKVSFKPRGDDPIVLSVDPDPYSTEV